MPKDFPTHATRIDVDYDYVAINNREFLVPVSAEMRLLQGRHDTELNTMEFRSYRHYGSDMEILPGYEPVAKKQIVGPTMRRRGGPAPRSLVCL